MFLNDAQELLARCLAPLPIERLPALLVSAEMHKMDGGGVRDRTELLGAAPTELLLRNYRRLAEILTFHSAEPVGPPPPGGPAASEASFRERIAALHDQRYSVRFPFLRPLSPPLDRLCRAIETMLHQPVSASAFWSRGRLRAPVHYDEHDIIAIQLRGTKTWHVSRGPSPLCNTWHGIPGPLPRLDAHHSVTLAEGDFLYLPRGLPHTVEAEGESLHLSLGFTPITVRDAIIAVLDQLAESDRGYRDTLSGELASCLMRDGQQSLLPRVAEAAARLHGACASAPILGAALQRRSARAVGALPALSAPPAPPGIDRETMLRPSDLAFCHLTANAQTIDFSYPGGHLYIHRGAQEALIFMINTATFCVRDVPGGLAEDACLALAEKLIAVGYLEVISGSDGRARPLIKTATLDDRG